MKKYVMLAIFSMLLLLTACGKKTEQIAIVETPNDNKIYIYRPTDSGVVAEEEMYQIKQPDSLSAAVEETMAALCETEWDQFVSYHTYMLDADNNLSLDFFAEEIPDTKSKILASAALCQTLFQLPDISSITIRILHEDEALIQEDCYTRDSFLFYGYDDAAMNIREVAIYYPNKEGNALSRGTVKVRQSAYESLPEQIVNVLVSRGILPAKSTVKSVYFSSGICYIDFEKTFMEGYPSTEGRLAIYALVNSVTELEGVDALYILVDGEPISNFHGFDAINKALSYDETLVK